MISYPISWTALCLICFWAAPVVQANEEPTRITTASYIFDCNMALFANEDYTLPNTSVVRYSFYQCHLFELREQPDKATWKPGDTLQIFFFQVLDEEGKILNGHEILPTQNGRAIVAGFDLSEDTKLYDVLHPMGWKQFSFRQPIIPLIPEGVNWIVQPTSKPRVDMSEIVFPSLSRYSAIISTFCGIIAVACFTQCGAMLHMLRRLSPE